MATNFAELRKSAKQDLEKLSRQLDQSNMTKETDYWKLTVDKAGNGFAIIRFLPAPKGEDIPYVREFSHGFKGPKGKYYIEKSLTTIGLDDPVSEYNSMLWNSGLDSDKEQARAQKRRKSYHGNIYVVKDALNPENEGKVFKYRFGEKILDKIKDALNPSELEDKEPLNPFDFWEGADFMLRAKNGDGGFRTYEKSDFGPQKAITKSNGSPMSDDEIEQLWLSQYPLQPIIAPEAFKSFDELKAKLYRVLELVEGPSVPKATKSYDDEEEEDVAEFVKTLRSEPTKSSSYAIDEDDADDDALDFFKKLAND